MFLDNPKKLKHLNLNIFCNSKFQALSCLDSGSHEPEITDVFGSRFCSDTIYDDRISLFMDYPKRGKKQEKRKLVFLIKKKNEFS